MPIEYLNILVGITMRGFETVVHSDDSPTLTEIWSRSLHSTRTTLLKKSRLFSSVLRLISWIIILYDIMSLKLQFLTFFGFIFHGWRTDFQWKQKVWLGFLCLGLLDKAFHELAFSIFCIKLERLFTLVISIGFCKCNSLHKMQEVNL